MSYLIESQVNPSGFIQPSQTGIFVTTSQTGIFITTGQTGAFGGGTTPTGNLTGAFYPLTSNPSGYTTNSNINPTWSYLTWGSTTTWNTTTGIVEDRKILILTGSSTLTISGLFNGWAGILETIQSGTNFVLTLPSGTKVANNGLGTIPLTSGVSGAIDMISFAYNGLNLFANIANQWT